MTDKIVTGFDFAPEAALRGSGGREEAPVWPDVAGRMKVDVAVNANGAVWVIHEQPFPDYIEWVEFDRGSRIMTFVTAGGKIQDLGLTVHPPMDEYVSRAREVCLVWMKDGHIADLGLVSLTVRNK